MTINALPVDNYLLPKLSDQMRWAPYIYDTGSGSIEVNMTQQLTSGTGLTPQAVIVDTTSVSATTQIVWDPHGVAFAWSVPPNAKKSYFIPASKPPVFAILPGAGSTGKIRLDLVNFPMESQQDYITPNTALGKNVTVVNALANPANVEPVVGGAAVTSSNPLPIQVENAVAAAVPSVPVTAGAIVSATNPLPTISPTKTPTLVSGTATAAGATALTAPPANVFLRRLFVSISDNGTQATAGNFALSVSVSGTVVYSETVYVPATALDSKGALVTRDFAFPAESLFPTGSSPTFSVSLGVALASGLANVSGYFS